MTRIALEEIEKAGIQTELISLAGKKITPCDSCFNCRKTHKCKFEDDDFEAIYKKIAEAEGFILATPVYYGGATPQITAFISRTFSHGGSWSGMQLRIRLVVL